MTTKEFGDLVDFTKAMVYFNFSPNPFHTHSLLPLKFMAYFSLITVNDIYRYAVCIYKYNMLNLYNVAYMYMISVMTMRY